MIPSCTSCRLFIKLWNAESPSAVNRVGMGPAASVPLNISICRGMRASCTETALSDFRLAFERCLAATGSIWSSAWRVWLGRGGGGGNGPHAEVGKMTTFNLLPLSWGGGGAWGVVTNMWHLETPASYESLPAPFGHTDPTLWIHTYGGGGQGGALILDRCRAFDLFASVDAHHCPHGTQPSRLSCLLQIFDNLHQIHHIISFASRTSRAYTGQKQGCHSRQCMYDVEWCRVEQWWSHLLRIHWELGWPSISWLPGHESL